MVRVDQCVALAGVLCVVFSITVAITEALIDGVRPGRGASLSNPSTPRRRNRPRHNATMRGRLRVLRNLLVLPAIRGQQHDAATNTTRTATERPRAWRSSCSRIS